MPPHIKINRIGNEKTSRPNVPPYTVPGRIDILRPLLPYPTNYPLVAVATSSDGSGVESTDISGREV